MIDASNKNRRRNLVTDQNGAVYLEFLVVIIPVWTLFLCIAQLSFISTANLVVRHAADAAVRSAIVVLPDDKNYYANEAERRVRPGPIDGGLVKKILKDLGIELFSVAIAEGSVNWDDVVEAFKSALKPHRLGIVSAMFGSRANAIKTAAFVPLMTLAPSNINGRDPALRDALSDTGSALLSLVYNFSAMTVEFPGASNKVTTPQVTVKVKYNFRCSVPLARRMICTKAGGFGGFVLGGYTMNIEKESTLLIHDAPYNYKEEKK